MKPLLKKGQSPKQYEKLYVGAKKALSNGGIQLRVIQFPAKFNQKPTRFYRLPILGRATSFYSLAL